MIGLDPLIEVDCGWFVEQMGIGKVRQGLPVFLALIMGSRTPVQSLDILGYHSNQIINGS